MSFLDKMCCELQKTNIPSLEVKEETKDVANLVLEFS